MTIRTKFKDGTFIPLENVKEGKEGELVEIEIKPVEGSRFFAVQPEAVQIDRRKWGI
ncbi:MAG: hypothetical protein SCARUB_03927 [Candidatus Scalindua rubra]|uniref:Uncharacterized protein n=1 Tax=Candidatus Scalindua rubra TaxID=1872076 RepID=A0A1E3X5S8_9BACT|nr:MAG: hypothetical protein SCARUB_03927 [Candidatus Scalindua rubra]